MKLRNHKLCFGTIFHFIMLFLLLYAQVIFYGARSVNGSRSKCSELCHCLSSYVDCSGKSLSQLPSDVPLWVGKLHLNNNRITEIKKGSLDNFNELVELKISRNFITKIEKESFKHLTSLEILEINKNRITEINSLTFDGLSKLNELRLRHNNLLNLLDGAFWGLPNLKILKLDNNSVTHVSKGWIYGLKSLNELHLSYNRIHSIEEDAWESCEDLNLLYLSFNDITWLHLKSFNHLGKLKYLKLNNNKISSIEEGAFKALSSLEVLDLNYNHISWVIEDMSGPFLGLKDLRKLNLAGNKISSINQDAFIGLNNLKELNLHSNGIRTIQSNPFKFMNLYLLSINSSSLLCDCHLAWFSTWSKQHSLNSEALVCAYPESIKDSLLTSVEPDKLTCANNNSPKPIITEGPQSAVIVSGSQVNISCHATSSSNSALVFKWRRNYDEIPSLSSVETNNSAVLHFPNVTLNHAGNYQCIVANSFGTVYSKKANLTVLVMPTMTKTPSNITVKAGGTARLECAAVGLPSPQVGWQKDGGTQFPAAQERRMHVMPTDDVFFIVNTKPADSGLYSCIARNSAGTVFANSTLTVLEPPTFINKLADQEVLVGKSIVIDCMGSGWPKPKLKWWKDGFLIKPSGRLYFAANNHLLVIINSKKSDSGCYQCELKNPMGTEKGSMQLIVSSNVYRKSDGDITGVIVIAVVCCAVGTSAIWVIIIYHSQKQFKHREQQLKTFPPRVNHQDTKSELSASSKDSGTGDSRRSNDNLPLDSNICLQEYNDTDANIEADSPLMTGFALVLEDDSVHKESNLIKEHQFPCFNHDRLSRSLVNDFTPTASSISVDNKPNSILCVFNPSRPTSV